HHGAGRGETSAAEGRAETGQVPRGGRRGQSRAAVRSQGGRPGRGGARGRGDEVMEIQILSIDGKKSGSVQLSDEIFGLEPRADLLHRCVNWQLAKRQRGTHKTKDRSEIWRTGKKMYGQKGTGNARHSSARVNLFRGGGRSFGPVVRSHATDLPKQLRAL